MSPVPSSSVLRAGSGLAVRAVNITRKVFKKAINRPCPWRVYLQRSVQCQVNHTSGR